MTGSTVAVAWVWEENELYYKEAEGTLGANRNGLYFYYGGFYRVAFICKNSKLNFLNGYALLYIVISQ